MANIVVYFKNGEKREFEHEGRSGGSYTKTLKLTDGCVTVEDEWGNKTSFPSSDVFEVTEKPHGWY